MDKVLIDYSYYQFGTYHGGGEYGDVILKQLLQIHDVSFGLVYFSNLPVRKELLQKCAESGWTIHTIEHFKEVESILKSNGYVRFYSALPYQDGRENVILPDNVEFIATYHGLREIELTDYIGILRGELFGTHDTNLLKESYKNYKDALMMSCNRRIITVSEHSKYSLIQYFPSLASEKIEVLYSPLKSVPSELPNEEIVLGNLGVTAQNYALLISGGTWYKNALNAAIAYDIVFDANYPFIPDNFRVIILGGKNNDNIQNSIRHRDRFVFPPFLPTGDLEILYKNAQLFVFPSLNEGFGYPPIEAMKYGTICACAADSSITEICRDMVLYFNPMMIGEIVNRLLQSFSQDIRGSLKQRIPSVSLVLERQKKDLERIIEIIAYGK